MRPSTFYARVSVEAGLDGLDEARRATAVVLQALRDRLTSDEGDQAAAQLPHELKTLWRQGEQPGRRPLKMRRREFLERVRLQAALSSTRTAEAVTAAVFAALKEQLSEGEGDDILAQLPRDLKAEWKRA